jgi:23S rRNA pseudouridine2605 synthase
MPERVQKILAQSGLGSRRYCEELIKQGRVKKHDTPVLLGDKAEVSDKLYVDGVAITHTKISITYKLNKPRGVICAAKDRFTNNLLTALVPDQPRVFPVGRLDKDSEGLILLTNDGYLSYLLTHPSKEIRKTYLVQIDSPLKPGELKALKQGVVIDSEHYRAESVNNFSNCWVKFVLTQGKNRQIRRMLDVVGKKTIRLIRTSIGPLHLGNLEPGQYDVLSKKELASLYRMCKLNISDSNLDRHNKIAKISR